MNDLELTRWQHGHSFGQNRRKPGEIRTLIVVLLTAATMVLEISAGIAYGSMALLADGLHMASHASALAISLFGVHLLLDRLAPDIVETQLPKSIEDAGDTRITDLHMWSIGPGVSCVIIAVVSKTPQVPERYQSLLPDRLGVEHVTVEVHKADASLCGTGEGFHEAKSDERHAFSGEAPYPDHIGRQPLSRIVRCTRSNRYTRI